MRRACALAALAVLIFSALAGELSVKPFVAGDTGYAAPGCITISVEFPQETTKNPVYLSFIVQNTYGPPPDGGSYCFTLDELTISDRATLKFGDGWREEQAYAPDGRVGSIITEPRSDMREVNLTLLRKEDVPVPSNYLKGGTYAIYFIRGTAILPALSAGQHYLTIYCGPSLEENIAYAHTLYQALCTITFMVTDGSEINVVSPRNRSYNVTDVELEFSMDYPVSNATYSLDGKENVTVPINAVHIEEVLGRDLFTREVFTGSELLTGLAFGHHNVTVYVWYETGIISASETIIFDVGDALQEVTLAPNEKSLPSISTPPAEPKAPSPSSSTPSPSESPTQKTTTPPVQQALAPFPKWISTAIIASAALVTLGLVTYFLKRKGKRSDT